jgi:hypothetical protein
LSGLPPNRSLHLTRPRLHFPVAGLLVVGAGCYRGRAGELVDYEAVDRQVKRSVFPVFSQGVSGSASAEATAPHPRLLVGVTPPTGRTTRGPHSTIRGHGPSPGPTHPIRPAAHSFGRGLRRGGTDAPQLAPSWRGQSPRVRPATHIRDNPRSLIRHPGAGASSGSASARHGTPSRNIAQHRTRILRASATTAGFFRA